VPYCPQTGTSYSSHEVALGYKDVVDTAVFVKFHLKGDPDGARILSWTTTPWTLPGNVALAVGPDITYSVVERGGEHYIEAEDGGDILGKNLVGMEYEPLYRIAAVEAHKGKKHVVVGADFVSTGEGTGIVHTAVMYGEDDFALGVREGLPMVQLLEPNGHYNAQAPEFVRSQYIKKAEKLIKEDLEHRKLLYSKESHTHSYPHCYRCGTPLIYNAVASWFINIQKIKAVLLKENEKITWVPEHLKHGRFHNIVEQAPDWTISRNRFWASPMPIWKEKGGERLLVVGSIEELLNKTQRSGNRYFVMRHGEADNNTRKELDLVGDPNNHLTEKGRKEAQEAVTLLESKSIDIVIASPFLRTQETADIVVKGLGMGETLVTDERIREIGPNEDGLEVRRRVGEFLFGLERSYQNKNILILSHGLPIWFLNEIAHRAPVDRSKTVKALTPAQVNELPFVPFPHNANYELDLHRPYIDEVKLIEGGRTFERVSEVLDCWVESGSMPFAAVHYPFDTSRVEPRGWWGFGRRGYPGDFIAEYIAQTRTWFYYMHAMGVALFGQRAFKSVVTTGTILAADGSKMSKSKGNYTDPYALMNEWGADALRLTLMGSVVMQAEDLNFRDEDVREAHNRVLGILWNSYKFFELYKEQYNPAVRPAWGAHPLDRWLRALLDSSIAEVTKAMDSYDLPRACRVLRSLVEDYSTWYLRRSRDRAKGQERELALAAQREALITIATLLAPITPFMSEAIYRGLDAGESVHLSAWPNGGEADAKLLEHMRDVRLLARQGLKLREDAGIKVRQPLGSITIDKDLPEELLEILKDELNVKEVRRGGEVALDTTLTPELKEEGAFREWVRTLQDWRKEQKLSVSDRPGILVHTPDAQFIRTHREALMHATGLISLEVKEGEFEIERL